MHSNPHRTKPRGGRSRRVLALAAELSGLRGGGRVPDPPVFTRLQPLRPPVHPALVAVHQVLVGPPVFTRLHPGPPDSAGGHPGPPEFTRVHPAPPDSAAVPGLRRGAPGPPRCPGSAAMPRFARSARVRPGPPVPPGSARSAGVRPFRRVPPVPPGSARSAGVRPFRRGPPVPPGSARSARHARHATVRQSETWSRERRSRIDLLPPRDGVAVGESRGIA